MAYIVFIAEQGAADFLIQGLPLGHGYSCMDNSRLPTVFKDILTHASSLDK
jgi:hypothetical protein